MLNALVATSACFLIVSKYAFVTGQVALGYAWLALSLSSIVHHSVRNIYTFWIDQVCVYAVTAIGATYLFIVPLAHAFGMVATFAAAVYIYWYGRLTHSMAHDPDEATAHRHHVALHVCVMLGHLILLHGAQRAARGHPAKKHAS